MSRFSFKLTVLVALALAAVVLTFSGGGQSVLADGRGSPAACTGGPTVKGDPVATYDAGAGNIVTGVCIKSGANMFGGNQHSGVLVNGTYEDGCYKVEGVGTQVVTVTRLLSGSSCQEISHIDIIVGNGQPPAATVTFCKVYDADADGVFNTGEQPIEGWQITVTIGTGPVVYFTAADGCVTVAADDGTSVTGVEGTPVEPNWHHTNATSATLTASAANPSFTFLNVCVGAGGGRTLGFWSNRNGQALFGADDLAEMVALNLRNASGGHFNPANYTAFRTWLLNASATNMAYMLSAQLAAMQLNVLNGFVSGAALIYAPGTTSANAAGFATVNAIIEEADASLLAYGLTLAGHPQRAYQEALKNALDAANNNKTFVQPQPCAFSFNGS